MRYKFAILKSVEVLFWVTLYNEDNHVELNHVTTQIGIFSIIIGMSALRVQL